MRLTHLHQGKGGSEMFRANNIFNKLEGVFILVNTLLPIILVLLTSLGIWLTWSAMNTSVNAYKVSLHSIIDSAVIAKGEVQKSVKQIADSAATIVDKGENIGNDVNQVVIAFDDSIGNFGNTFKAAVKTLDIKIKIPVINKNVKIPFGSILAEPLKGVGNEIAKPFKPLSKSFANLGNSVSDIQSEVANITSKLDQLKKWIFILIR